MKEIIKEIFKEIEKNRDINFLSYTVIKTETFEEIKKKYCGEI